MKNYALALILLAIVIAGCGENQTKQAAQTAPPKKRIDFRDYRPQDEITFMNRLVAEQNVILTGNAVDKDAHADAFKKYALDSLKHVSNWEMIVDGVNDLTSESTSVAQDLFPPDRYNLLLKEPMQIDRTVDTISMLNRVDFVITIEKQPKTDTLKKMLDLMKTLKKGDTVYVSGAITHTKKGEVTFKEFYSSDMPWNLDILQSAITKKPVK